MLVDIFDLFEPIGRCVVCVKVSYFVKLVFIINFWMSLRVKIVKSVMGDLKNYFCMILLFNALLLVMEILVRNVEFKLSM